MSSKFTLWVHYKGKKYEKLPKWECSLLSRDSLVKKILLNITSLPKHNAIYDQQYAEEFKTVEALNNNEKLTLNEKCVTSGVVRAGQSMFTQQNVLTNW